MRGFLDWIEKNQKYIFGKSLLLGISGGVDSMVLLDLFIKQSERLQLTFGIFHLDHMFRSDSHLDYKLVEDSAKLYNIPFYGYQIDASKYADTNGVSFEMGARELRHNLIKQIMTEYNYDICALAHHLDDRAETILMNIFRGSGLNGLCAMSDVDGHIIRPLLSVTKSEILEYATAHSIKYRDDYTNFESEYARNKIRNQLVSYIEENYATNIALQIGKMAELLSVDNDYILSEMRTKFSELISEEVIQDGQVIFSLNVQDFSVLHMAIKTRIVLEIFMRINKNTVNIGSQHIFDIINFIENGANATFYLFKDIHFEHGVSEVRIMSQNLYNEFNKEYEIPLLIGDNIINGNKTVLRVSVLDADSCDISGVVANENRNPRIFFVDASHLEGLIVRNRRDGDFMRPIDMGGKSKKIKQIMNEMKIYSDQKMQIPMVVFENEILWLCGVRKGNKHIYEGKLNKTLKIELIDC